MKKVKFGKISMFIYNNKLIFIGKVNFEVTRPDAQVDVNS